jgi:glycosyltransferase involved in cell wall biosynthesis
VADEAGATTGDGSFVVFLVTSFFPLHGVEHVLEAAKLLESTPAIRFRIVGDGYLRDTMLARARALRLTNTTFEGLVPAAELPARMAGADICLGQFGATAASDMVVPAKVFDALAMAKPVVTSGTLAIRDAFVDGTLAARPGRPARLGGHSYRDPSLRRDQPGHWRFREARLDPIGGVPEIREKRSE